MPEGSVTLSSNPMQCLNYGSGCCSDVKTSSSNRDTTAARFAFTMRGCTGKVSRGVMPSISIPRRTRSLCRRGLAYSPAGHELLLTTDVCVNVPLWLEKHRSDPGFEIRTDEASPGVEIFDAYVTLAPSACLSRPVPSIAQTCGDASTSGGVAYSRVMEVIDIRLVPGFLRSRAAARFTACVCCSASSSHISTKRRMPLRLPTRRCSTHGTTCWRSLRQISRRRCWHFCAGLPLSIRWRRSHGRTRERASRR